MSTIIKILLVEDHPALREGVRLHLEKQTDFISNIKEAENGEKAIRILEKEQFDVVLLDINLPGKDGLYIANYFKKIKPGIKFIAYSSFVETYLIHMMMNAGVRGYLSKSADLPELVKAIITVHNGGEYYDPEILKKAKKKTYKVVDIKTLNQFTAFRFTAREKQVLQLMTHDLDSTEIAQRLNLKVKTVDCHKSNMIRKAGVKNSNQLIKLAKSLTSN